MHVEQINSKQKKDLLARLAYRKKKTTQKKYIECLKDTSKMPDIILVKKESK